VKVETPKINVNTTSAFNVNYKLECGPMPNVMAALPNISGAAFNAAKFG